MAVQEEDSRGNKETLRLLYNCRPPLPKLKFFIFENEATKWLFMREEFLIQIWVRIHVSDSGLVKDTET